MAVVQRYRVSSRAWIGWAVAVALTATATAAVSCRALESSEALDRGPSAQFEPVELQDWAVDRYCRVRDFATSHHFISYFGKQVLREADLVVVGAVLRVVQDVPRSEAADLQVVHVLHGGDETMALDETVLRAFSPQRGFFHNCHGENLFVLKRWNADGFCHVIANFPLDAARRHEQIETVMTLIALESIEDLGERKQKIKAACIRGVRAGDDWVSNVWGLQLAFLCRDYATMFTDRDLTTLKQLERTLVTGRPSATGAIRGVTLAITYLIAMRLKREWARDIRDGDRPTRLRAATKWRDHAIANYAAAFTFTDMSVLYTLKQREADPEIQRVLAEADLAIGALLERPEE